MSLQKLFGLYPGNYYYLWRVKRNRSLVYKWPLINVCSPSTLFALPLRSGVLGEQTYKIGALFTLQMATLWSLQPCLAPLQKCLFTFYTGCASPLRRISLVLLVMMMMVTTMKIVVVMDRMVVVVVAVMMVGMVMMMGTGV